LCYTTLMDIQKRMRRQRRRVWFGPVQQKILLLLLGGMTLACARSPKKQLQIIKGVHEGLKDINRQAAERAVSALYDSKLLEARQNADGTISLLLNENGKKRALTYHMRTVKIQEPKVWDGKWRIVLYDIPEDEREKRDAFREHLTQLNMRKFQHSASIHPFDCKDEVTFFIELLDIRKYVRFIEANYIDDEIYWKRRFKIPQKN